MVCRCTRPMLINRMIIASNGSATRTSHVSRGTPQRGVLSSLLRIVALNEILLQLNGEGVKAIAYAEDILLMVSGMFPFTISEIMKRVQRRLHL